MISKSVAWSKERQTADIHAAVVAYALQHAGTDMDLDYDLEEAGIECLSNILVISYDGLRVCRHNMALTPCIPSHFS